MAYTPIDSTLEQTRREEERADRRFWALKTVVIRHISSKDLLDDRREPRALVPGVGEHGFSFVPTGASSLTVTRTKTGFFPIKPLVGPPEPSYSTNIFSKDT